MRVEYEIGVPENAYGYVYMNYYISTDKWYIGRHKADKFDKYYYGSGTKVLECMNNNTITNKDVCSMVLDWATSNEELNELEFYWVRYFNAVKDENFYNQVDGGGCELSNGDNPTLVPIICVELNKRFRTISDAAKWCGRSKSALSNALRGVTEVCAGYHWVYEDIDSYKKMCEKRSKNYFSDDKSFRKGSKHTDEAKLKMHNSSVGRKHSEKSIEKMRKSQKERFKNNPVSDETRKKLSEALSGEKNPMYGKHHTNIGGWHQSDKAKEAIRKALTGRKLSEDLKRKMSVAQKERYRKEPIKPHVIEALRQANLGKPMSEETKQKLREANLGKSRSEESRRKSSEKLLGHSPYSYIEVYCPELNMKFHTIREAAEFVGLKDSRNLRACLKGDLKVKHSGKYMINGEWVKLSWVKVGSSHEH